MLDASERMITRVPVSRWAGIVMCLFGGLFVLLAIDEARWQAPTTSSGVYFPGYSFSTAGRLVGWDDQRLRRGADETPVEFAARANQEIFSAVYHCRDISGSTWASQRLGALGLFGFAEHGVLSPQYLQCGFCSQVSYLLSRTLRNNGIDAFVYGLNGHVVTVFSEGDSQFIADPDYGIGPWEVNISNSESMSKLASANYTWLTDRFGVKMAGQYKAVTNAYGTTEDNVQYMSPEFMDRLAEKQTKVLDAASVAIFVLPAMGLFLFAFGLVSITRKHRR